MTVAKLSGMPEVQVEFMAGHGLDDMTQAYWQARPEELTQKYREHYHALRVLKPKLDEVKIRKLETTVMERDDIVRALVENGKIKGKEIERLTREMDSLSKNVIELKGDFIKMFELIQREEDFSDVLRKYVKW